MYPARLLSGLRVTNNPDHTPVGMFAPLKCKIISVTAAYYKKL